jgi:metallo-beta-lactamase family protein
MNLTFLGATGTVTGSKNLLTVDNLNILVDCGLFQGIKEHRLRNWDAFPIPPNQIDAVVLTHAHIDHSGYLPLLAKRGFHGPIYSTKATLDLCEILLPDCGYIQEEDAKFAKKHGFSKHENPEPLYTEKDAERVMEQFEPVPFGEYFEFTDLHAKKGKHDPAQEPLRVQFNRMGHILGSASLTFKTKHRTLVFSGDMGRMNDPILKPPTQIQEADYLVIESTYGNRLHEAADPEKQLGEIILKTIQRGGSVLLPTFAVGRAQTLLYFLHQLKLKKVIPDYLPIYMDSPMAIDATELMAEHQHELKLSPRQCKEACHVAEYIQTQEQSKALNPNRVPCVILSASGMMTGGRILHHLKTYAPDRRNTLVLTGYQAEGTRGDTLMRQENQRQEKQLKIHGELVPVNAEVAMLPNLSAHADYAEMTQWLRHFRKPPLKTFINHGNPESSEAFKIHLESELGWQCHIPQYLEKIQL